MSDATASSTEQLDALLEKGKISNEEYETLRAAMRDSAKPQARPATGWRKSWTHRQLGGVCGGISNATGLKAWNMRLAFAIGFFLTGGFALFLYLAFYVILPWDENDPPPRRKGPLSWDSQTANQILLRADEFASRIPDYIRQRNTPRLLWVSLIVLSIFTIFAFSEGLDCKNGTMMIGALVNAALVAGLYLRYRVAYFLMLAGSVVGPVFIASEKGLGDALTVLAVNALIVVPMLMCTSYFFPGSDSGETEGEE